MRYYFEYVPNFQTASGLADSLIEANNFDEACRNFFTRHRGMFTEAAPNFDEDTKIQDITAWVTNTPAIVHGGFRIPEEDEGDSDETVKLKYSRSNVRGFMSNCRITRFTTTQEREVDQGRPDQRRIAQVPSPTPTPPAPKPGPSEREMANLRNELRIIQDRCASLMDAVNTSIATLNTMQVQLGQVEEKLLTRPDNNERQLEPEI